MTQKEEKVFQDVEKKYNASRKEKDKLFKDFNDYEDIWWGNIEQDKNAWKSNLYDPVGFEKVERIVAHLFATPPRGAVLPRDMETDPINAPKMDQLIRYQWNMPKQEMFAKLVRMGRGMCIFGTSFGELLWRYEKQTVVSREGEEFMEKEVVKWDDPYFSDLYIYDCFPDPSATSIDDMQYFIVDKYTTIEDLRSQNIPKYNLVRYKNLGDLEKAIEDFKDANHSTIQDEYRNHVDQILGNDSNSKKNRIKIRTMYTKDRWVTVVPDFLIVIEDRKNPYTHGELPIHMLRDYEYPNQLYGRGEIDVIQKLQKGLNDTLNQRADNVRMIMSPAVKVRAGARYVSTWKFKPGQKWVMDDINNEAGTFAIPDVTGNTFAQQTNYYKDAIANAVGQTDILTRQTSSTTATQQKLAAGEQNARIKQKENAVDAFVVRLINQMIQLNQQMITEARIVRIAGSNDNNELKDMEEETTYINGQLVQKLKKGKGYSTLVVEPDDLVGSYDFIVESGSMTAADPNDNFQNSMTAVQLLQQNRQLIEAEGNKINMTAVIEGLLGKLGIKNVDNIIIPSQSAIMQPAMGNQPMQPQSMLPQTQDISNQELLQTLNGQM